MTADGEITRHHDGPFEVEWVATPPPIEPIEVVDSDPLWPQVYDDLAARIRGVLGDDVLGLEHVGSTSVAGLAAKPVIDIDLTVADSSNEDAYVPALEAIGFDLLIREPNWHEHRVLQLASPSGGRRANLHVWSPGSPEAIRHLLLRDWLREHPDDCARYGKAKRDAAAASTAAGEDVMAYNVRKEPTIREILDRVFAAHGMIGPGDG